MAHSEEDFLDEAGKKYCQLIFIKRTNRASLRGTWRNQINRLAAVEEFPPGDDRIWFTESHYLFM